MSRREVVQLVPALEVTEGAGVTVHRTLGTPALRNLDPFLMLDHFSSDDPNDYVAGFPEHPHRGFNTFTYMLDGHMRHGDSMGNRGDLGPGGAQWMKAASGVIHSEMPQQIGGVMRGFQLWVNLPAREKMSEPAYQEIRPESVPETDADGVHLRLLAGAYQGHHGPVSDAHTGVRILDIRISPSSRFDTALPADHVGFFYVFEGGARVGHTEVPLHHLAVLGSGESISVEAGTGGARLLLVSGKPIGEPIVQQGPFVMNSGEEINQAVADYRAGRLVRTRAAVAER